MLKPEAVASNAIRDSLRDVIDRRHSISDINRLMDRAGEEAVRQLRAVGYLDEGDDHHE